MPPRPPHGTALTVSKHFSSLSMNNLVILTLRQMQMLII